MSYDDGSYDHDTGPVDAEAAFEDPTDALDSASLDAGEPIDGDFGDGQSRRRLRSADLVGPTRPRLGW